MGPAQRAQRLDAWSHPGRRDRRVPRGDLIKLSPAPRPEGQGAGLFFAGRETNTGNELERWLVSSVTALLSQGDRPKCQAGPARGRNRKVRPPGRPTITVEAGTRIRPRWTASEVVPMVRESR